MNPNADTQNALTATAPRVVLPFYLYAAISFLIGTLMLLLSGENFTGHFFHPHTLAITHMMTLGWGTMIIIGASHQLIPVITGHPLHSLRLAGISFYLAAAGIPLLIYGFYHLNMGWPAKWGGILVLLSVICYMFNLVSTAAKAGSIQIHSVFMLTAACWLLSTVILGLFLVYNFTHNFLPRDSLAYLPLHAHLGVIGWFLLLVIGVGSRLIPMFLISKYSNTKLLWLIYFLVNAGLISFIFLFMYAAKVPAYIIPVATILLAILLFAYYCFRSIKARIRKKIDDQLKVSLLSIAMMLIPVFVLAVIITLLLSGEMNSRLVLIYGFVIFFGWLTAIILGMTFKTLPFIVWNRVYHQQAGRGPTPTPNELFSHTVFRLMAIGYLAGFILFIAGAWMESGQILSISSILLVVAAALYNWNVIKLLFHKIPGR